MILKIKVLSVLAMVLILFSCNEKLDQSTMFGGRTHKTKKKGIYDAGLNSKKSVSMQLAKDYDKQTKNDTDPKKAARKIEKEQQKKKRASQKLRAKRNKKVRTKVKTTKGRPGGEG